MNGFMALAWNGFREARRNRVTTVVATFAMLLVASLWPVLAGPARAAAVVFVAWAGIARIWTGAHFPADVLAGYILGAACAAFATWLVQTPMKLKRVQFRRSLRSPP